MNEIVRVSVERDWFDICIALIPLVISLVSVGLALYTLFRERHIKDIEGNLVWDDFNAKLYIIVRNIGRRVIVIDKITMLARSNKRKEALCLGTRENVWSAEDGLSQIRENEMLVLQPNCNSNYDVFSYRGHAFDVDKTNEGYRVYLVITDLDKRTWEFATLYSLGELHEYVEFVAENPV